MALCRTTRNTASGHAGPPASPDQVQTILDEPALAAGLDYFSLGGLDISPNGRYLAYTTDTDGSERYTLHVKDLATGELLPETLTDISGGTIWANDNTTLFYVVLTDNWQPYLVRSHRLGEDVGSRSRHLRRNRRARFSSASAKRTRKRSSRSAPATT